jgi:hypothetical protein
MAMQADTAALEDLAERVAELERRLRDVVRLQDIIRGAGEPAPVPQPRRHLRLVTNPPGGRAHAPGATTPPGVCLNGKEPQ